MLNGSYNFLIYAISEMSTTTKVAYFPVSSAPSPLTQKNLNKKENNTIPQFPDSTNKYYWLLIYWYSSYKL